MGLYRSPSSQQTGLNLDYFCLRMPVNVPSWHPELTTDMLFLPRGLLEGSALQNIPPFWPEFRLRWFDTFAPWMAYILEFPQVMLEDAPQFQLLHLCTRVHPIFWAWTSDECSLIQIDQLIFHDTLWQQFHQLQALLIELEHVLAQDWFHCWISFGLMDGFYASRRSIICRYHGDL